jgi:hypothetical protein
MDGVDARGLRHVEDFLDAQIRLDRALAAAHHVGFVGLVPVLVEPVFVAVDGDGANAELVAGTKDADGDLAAVRAEQLLDRARMHVAS